MVEPGPKKSKPVRFSATLGQLRTLKDGQITVTLAAGPDELKKILELITACQAGNSLLISAQIIKPDPKVKKDAKEKPDSQKQKGPRRVRRYPYK
jgi:hypothetical protein